MSDLFGAKMIEREYVCREKTELISIVSTSDAIRIVSGDVDNVTVSYMECPGKHEYTLTEQDGKLSLEYISNISIIWGLQQIFTDTTIDVTVPGDFCGALELTASSGRTVLSDLNIAYLNSGSSSGSVKASNVNSAGPVCIRNSSGTIKLKDISAADVTVNNTSGGVNMDQVRSLGGINAGVTSGSISLSGSTAQNDISLSNHSGAIRLEDVTAGGSVNASNTSGGIHFASLKAGGNLSFSTTSGSIKGSVIGNESDYSITSNTTTGSNGLTDSEGGAKELNAHATSGSIKIVFI